MCARADTSSSLLQCQISVANQNLKFGIWVNIAKNLRLKSIEYHDLGFTTDIPRPIILQVRNLWPSLPPFPFQLGRGMKLFQPENFLY